MFKSRDIEGDSNVDVGHGRGHMTDFVEEDSVGRGRRGKGGKGRCVRPDEAEQ